MNGSASPALLHASLLCHELQECYPLHPLHGPATRITNTVAVSTVMLPEETDVAVYGTQGARLHLLWLICAAQLEIQRPRRHKL